MPKHVTKYRKVSTVKDTSGFSCISDIRETAYMSTLPNTLPKDVAKLFTKRHKDHFKEQFQNYSYSFSKGPSSMLRELFHSDSPAPQTRQLPQLSLKEKLPHVQHRMSCH